MFVYVQPKEAGAEGGADISIVGGGMAGREMGESALFGDRCAVREGRGGFTRRSVVRAASAALLGAGLVAHRSSPAHSQEAGGTRANRWTPEPSIDAKAGESDAAGFRSFTTDYPFFALGASWDANVGTWPVLDIEVSADGAAWSDTQSLVAGTADGGRPTREGRYFTPLMFADGAQYVRFRTRDANGNLGSVDGLSFVYIDASDGPWEYDVSPSPAGPDDDTMVPPALVTREAWGADESFRFDGSEIWPPEYDEVRHVIIHHTDTPTEQDPLVAIRSIYYYHAVEQGWGDIGYNYLVDRNGTIYEGRYGGQNVVGGHSYDYAWGSSGICVIGTYQDAGESDLARDGLVAISAWVARKLDPLGTENFHEIPDLPTICAHRDVNATSCPGDALFDDLPYIRTLVAETLAEGSLDSGAPGGIAVRDRVIVQTDDGSALTIRAEPGVDSAKVDALPVGTAAIVTDGPVLSGGENWYQLSWDSSSGWAVARYLIVSPPDGAVGDGFAFGANLVLIDVANLRAAAGGDAEILGEIPAGEWAAAIEGPKWAGEHAWYRIGTEHFGRGWVAGDYLDVAPVDSNPVARFAVGTQVTAASPTDLHPRPGRGQTIAATLPEGTVMTITVGAYGVTGAIWYGVYGDFGGGWVAEATLEGAA